MTRLIGSFVLAGVVLVLAVVASPSAAALPPQPTAPCLLGAVCPPDQLPDPLSDPCAPVLGVDPCRPCADPACLAQLPDVPNDVPMLPAEPPVDVPPLPADVPALPTDTPTDTPTEPAPVPGVPAPVPDATVPQSTSSSEGGGPDSDSAAGGGWSRPVAVDTSSVSSRPAALAHAARSFALLFVLAGLVGVYLLVQGRLDARDPKLVAAPIDGDDEVIRFR
jgi:hypothetical protein